MKTISNLLNRNRTVLGLVLLGIAIRLLFFMVVQTWDEDVLRYKILPGDARRYHNLAIELFESDAYSSPTSQFYTPGYPFFVGTIYSIVDKRPWVVLLVQIALNVFTLFLVYRLGLLLANPRIAWLSGVLYTLEPLAIYYTNAFLTETLFSLIFTGSMISLFHGIKNRRLNYLLASGFLLGLATYVRPVTLYFPIVIVAMILIWPKRNATFKAYTTIGLVLVFLITIFPWTYRNYHQYGAMSFTSFKGFNLLFFNATAVEKAKTGKTYIPIRAEFRDVAKSMGADDKCDPTFDNSRIFNKIATHYILNNLPDYIRLHLKGMLFVFLDVGVIGICNYLNIKTGPLTVEFTSSHDNLTDMVSAIFQIKPMGEILFSMPFYMLLFGVYLCFLIGAIRMIRDKEYINLFFILTILLYFSFLPGVIGQARYRVPIIPFYIIVSAKGFWHLFDCIRRRRAEHRLMPA